MAAPVVKSPPPKTAEEIYDGVFGEERFKSFIVKPSHIKKVWGSTSSSSSMMKEELFQIFQNHFKPKSSLEPEKVEYNEINIFVEYSLYNLVFVKNQLLFDDYKAALFLHLCWQLLEFNPDQPTASPLL